MKTLSKTLVLGANSPIAVAYINKLSKLNPAECFVVIAREKFGGKSTTNANVQEISIDLEKGDTDTFWKEHLELEGPFTKILSCLRYRQTVSGSLDTWGDVELCLKSQAKLIECIATQLKQQNLNGSVVLISSLASQGITSSQTLDYHAAKSGVDILVKYMAVKYGPAGIRFNSIAPIYYDKEFLNDKGSYSVKKAALCSNIPLGHLASPSDIANVIAFLTGKESAYITGQTIVVDGGLSCRLHEDLALGVICSEN